MGVNENLLKRKSSTELVHNKKTMRILSLLILGSFILLSWLRDIFAEDTLFDTYKQDVASKCETDKPWINTKEWGWNIVAIPAYPELTKSAIESRKDAILSTKTSTEDRARLIADMDALMNDNGSTYLSIGLARIEYQTAMNKIFGCAIIQSRQNKLENLIKKIASSYPSAKSEITEKLKKEWQKYLRQKESLGCSIERSGEIGAPETTRVINAALRQYCHYDSYLRYIKTSFDENNNAMFSLEASLFQANNTSRSVPNTTEAWRKSLTKMSADISLELIRARSVLPQAIETFREMDRTFSVHLMLVVIYDDYLRFRDNLGKYVANFGQLMEKVQNSQSENKQ